MLNYYYYFFFLPIFLPFMVNKDVHKCADDDDDYDYDKRISSTMSLKSCTLPYDPVTLRKVKLDDEPA